MREVTVLYDGGCALCAGVARRLLARDGVSLAPIRSARGAELLHDVAPSAREASLHVVQADGTRRSGADALPELLRRFRGGRPAAWLVERFPRTARRGYALVARNRMFLSLHRGGGGPSTRALHRSRFG